MTDGDLAAELARSLRRRVQRVDPRPDPEQLFARLERRANRQRRIVLVSLVALLVVAAGFGYVAGRADAPVEDEVVAINEGVAGAGPSDPAIEPENVDAAVAAIVQAFHDAYDGATPDAIRRAAVQGGPELEGLRREAIAFAEGLGYTVEQFAGTTIEVLDTTFVDRTHAVVHFTLTIPGHGAVIVGQAGYAVLDGGRWRVSLRTACDLLSLGGLGRPCPPRAP